MTAPRARVPVAGLEEDECRLRELAAGGDEEAFAVLYRRCRDTVYRYLVRRINGDPHLAQDLMHETFTRAYARIGNYQEMGRPFVAWLLTIASNLVVDHYKSGWRRFQVTRGDVARDVDNGASELMWIGRGDDVAGAVAAEDYQRYVRGLLTEAMGGLTSRQQQVMQLRFVEGLSVRDTAMKLDTHEGAVKAATYRAIRALARNPQLRSLHADQDELTPQLLAG